jgi:RimJ/RimL family protein N-acetyltransferase
VLIGDAICLGPLLRNDAPLLFNWRNTLAVARSNGPFRPIDQVGFDGWFNAGSDPTRVVFAIRLKPDLRLLGFVQLTDIRSAARSAELGIMIGAEEDRNKGYGQEAVRMALGYAWRDLNLQRVFLHVIGAHPAAVRAYGKAGFEIEGVMRRAAYGDGHYSDVTIMGCLHGP